MTVRLSAGLPALALALLLAACSGSSDAPPPPAKPRDPTLIAYQPGAPELDAVTIVPAIESALPVATDLNARIAVDESVTGRVTSPVAGRVVRILADIGDPVRAGQALASLDAPDLFQAQADLAKANADADLKRRAAARARDLFQGQAIARRDLEAAEADLAAADAEARRARLRAANLGGGNGADLGLASPIAGYVIDRQVNPGQQVQPGQGPLFTVTNPRQLWLLIDTPESAVGRARLGERVDFGVDAYPGRTFHGTVGKIGLAVDPATRRVQVRASVANPDLALKPEMFARARFLTDDGRTALKVPNAALIEAGVKSYVFRVEAPGRFRRVGVDVVARGASDSYVSGGIKPGDSVVAEGALLLNAQLSGDS